MGRHTGALEEGKSGDQVESWGLDGRGVSSDRAAQDAAALSTEEESLVASLRPSCFDEYVGQDHVRTNLQIACNASKRRGEPLDITDCP